MQKGIIGKKMGMTQIFDENGKVVPVTVVEAGPCTVVQKKTVESDGYVAVQLGYGDISAKKVSKPAKGHFDKADVAPKRTLREFRLDDISAMNVGDILKADVFAVGDRISNGAYGKENERPFHNFGNNLVRRLIKVIYGYAFEDVMTGYRAFTRAFVKTMPVMSGGFQIETEISIWAVDRRWRVADVPIDYRDRPEGSESKLSTFSDGMLVLAAIASLFRDYRPMAFFGWLGLALAVVGLCFGLPVVAEYFDTGYVAKLPSAVLAVALMIVATLSWTAGLILDTVAKSHRRQWEMSVYRVMEADAER